MEQNNEMKRTFSNFDVFLFFLTCFIFVVGGGVTIFIFIYLNNSIYATNKSVLAGLCSIETVEISEQFLGGETILYAFKTHVIDAIQKEEVIGLSEWDFFAEEIVEPSTWNVLSVGYLDYINSTENIIPWQVAYNATIRSFANTTGVDLKNKSDYMPLRLLWYVNSTSTIPSNATGIDYFTDATRNDLIRRAQKSRTISVSDVYMTSLFTPGVLTSVISLFLPIYNGDLFAGGVIGLYSRDSVVNVRQPDITYSLKLNNVTVYEDATFNDTIGVESQINLQIADRSGRLTCTENYGFQVIPLVVILLGLILSIALPCIILIYYFTGRRYKKQVTARLHAEEETRIAILETSAVQQSSELKSSFLSNMSHEIRTPLNGIVSMVEYFSGDDFPNPTTKQAEYIRVGNQSVDALSHIITDVLDFSDFFAGHMKLSDNQQTDLHVILRNIIDTYTHNINKNALVLVTDIPDPFYIESDPKRLEQLIAYFVDNATKFTTSGKVILSVSCENGTQMDENGENRPRMKFIIADNGIGISDDALENLFTPFTQGDSSMTRKFGGTGIGLALAKAYIDLFGGKVDVQSELGKGSTFTFWVPLKKILHPILPKRPAEAGKGKEEGKENVKKILIIDDNPINLKVASLILNKLGYLSETLSDGSEALKLDDLSGYMGILMDIQMPIMDGYETTKQLRDRNVNIPIIAMTANVQPGEREKCKSLGMNDYLEKPLRKDTFKKTLEENGLFP